MKLSTYELSMSRRDTLEAALAKDNLIGTKFASASEAVAELLKLDTHKDNKAFLQEFRDLKSKYPFIDELCKRKNPIAYWFKTDNYRAQRYKTIIAELQKNVIYVNHNYTLKHSLFEKLTAVNNDLLNKTYHSRNNQHFEDYEKDHKIYTQLKTFMENLDYTPPENSKKATNWEQFLKKYPRFNALSATNEDNKELHNVEGISIAQLKKQLNEKLGLPLDTPIFIDQDKINPLIEQQLNPLTAGFRSPSSASAAATRFPSHNFDKTSIQHANSAPQPATFTQSNQPLTVNDLAKIALTRNFKSIQDFANFAQQNKITNIADLAQFARQCKITSSRNLGEFTYKFWNSQKQPLNKPNADGPHDLNTQYYSKQEMKFRPLSYLVNFARECNLTSGKDLGTFARMNKLDPQEELIQFAQSFISLKGQDLAELAKAYSFTKPELIKFAQAMWSTTNSIQVKPQIALTKNSNTFSSSNAQKVRPIKDLALYLQHCNFSLNDILTKFVTEFKFDSAQMLAQMLVHYQQISQTTFAQPDLKKVNLLLSNLKAHKADLNKCLQDLQNYNKIIENHKNYLAQFDELIKLSNKYTQESANLSSVQPEDVINDWQEILNLIKTRLANHEFPNLQNLLKQAIDKVNNNQPLLQSKKRFYLQMLVILHPDKISNKDSFSRNELQLLNNIAATLTALNENSR